MTDKPITLTPDDHHQEAIDLLDDKADTGQPYGLASCLIGLIALFLMRSIIADREVGVYLGALTGIAAYLGLTIARPKLPLLALTICAAELGALYGMPTRLVFGAPWRDAHLFAESLKWFIASGIIGILAGLGLGVQRSPVLIISCSFLFMFVITNMWYLVPLLLRY